MDSPSPSLSTLPSAELLRRLSLLVRRERGVEVELLVHLGEVDARRLYLEEGCSSIFDYCVRVLRFAEGVAYKRIRVARATREHPELLEAIRRGDLHVTAANLLAPQLARENVSELILAATHKTAEEVRALLADRCPRPDVPASVRMRPEPLGGERYCVRFTADPDTWAELQELRALMRHQVPDGDVGRILGKAVSALLSQVRTRKLAACSRPRSSTSTPRRAPASRAIPAAVRREVFRRDDGRCTYPSPTGGRCGSQAFIEFHHVDPWARSRHHSVDGITLRCRAHNQHEAERDSGAQDLPGFATRSGRTKGNWI